MADFSLGSQGTGRVEAWENWNGSTQVSMHYKLSVWVGNAYNGYGPTAGPYWEGSLGGGHVGSGYWTYSNNQGWRVLREIDVTFNKDANGNISIGIYGHVNGKNAPYMGANSASWTHYPARIGIAPTHAGHIADSILVTTARLGAEISSVGLGTSANMTMYIRKLGDVSWTDLGNQADVGGYNYWYPTGLIPGTTYEYVTNYWNNNGDYSQSPISQFSTLPAPANSRAMLGVLGIN
jgi:hypothetical protein